VGGGHYYAYIRPSNFFDYALLEEGEVSKVNPRGGQWFKFDDETVLKVRPFEAINYCFGRPISSMSSAYMLVYIRESDAGEVSQASNPPCSLDLAINEIFILH
jgi:hypothetical protein